MHAAARFMLKHAGVDLAGLETIHDSPLWALARPRLSIITTVHRADASPLIRAIARCKRALEIEIVIFDDGSRDDALLTTMQIAVDHALTPVRIAASWIHRGRAAARISAAAHARSPWLLLIDADMAPDDEDFLLAYIAAIDAAPAPCVIDGGHSLPTATPDPRIALHRWQAGASECLPAAQRNAAPGRHILPGNLLVHRDVLAACPFDATFASQNWEAADWGLRVEKAFPVRHIDNPVTRARFDADDALMSRFGCSDASFSLLAQRHPAITEMSLHRAARLAQLMPFRPALRSLTGAVARAGRLPIGLRGRALQAWRALGYAERV